MEYISQRVKSKINYETLIMYQYCLISLNKCIYTLQDINNVRNWGGMREYTEL